MSRNDQLLFHVNLLGGLRCDPELITGRRGRELLALLILAEHVPNGHDSEGVLKDWLAQWYAPKPYRTSRKQALDTLASQLNSPKVGFAPLIEEGVPKRVKFRGNVVVSTDIRTIFQAYEATTRNHEQIIKAHGGKLLFKGEQYHWLTENWFVAFYASLTQIYLASLCHLTNGAIFLLERVKGNASAQDIEKKWEQAIAYLNTATDYLSNLPPDVVRHASVADFPIKIQQLRAALQPLPDQDRANRDCTIKGLVWDNEPRYMQQIAEVFAVRDKRICLEIVTDDIKFSSLLDQKPWDFAIVDILEPNKAIQESDDPESEEAPLEVPTGIRLARRAAVKVGYVFVLSKANPFDYYEGDLPANVESAPKQWSPKSMADHILVKLRDRGLYTER